MAAAASAASVEAPGRLTRQGRIDVRLALTFEDWFKPNFNRSLDGKASSALVPFVSHRSGKKTGRQAFAINYAFWCLAGRRCDCRGDCECGSLIPYDSCVPCLASDLPAPASD